MKNQLLDHENEIMNFGQKKDERNISLKRGTPLNSIENSSDHPKLVDRHKKKKRFIQTFDDSSGTDSDSFDGSITYRNTCSDFPSTDENFQIQKNGFFKSNNLIHRANKLCYSKQSFFRFCDSNEWRKKITSLSGLSNHDENGRCKNICYLNSVVQCFAATPPFVQWILQETVNSSCMSNDQRKKCTFCSLRLIIKSICSKSSTFEMIDNPNDRCRNEMLSGAVKSLSSMFNENEQQDPFEFLLVLLDQMNKSLNISDSPSSEESIDYISHMFGAQIERSTDCGICSSISSSTVWERVLSLNVQSCATLEESFENYFAEQLLDGENSLNCSRCSRNGPGKTRFEIIRTSPILFIHLQKFAFDKKSMSTKKINQPMSFPEILSLDRFLKRKFSDRSTTYQLYCVIIHKGDTANHGHILCYVLSSQQVWFKADDEKVTQVSSHTVFHQHDAYILGYKRVSKIESSTAAHNESLPLIQSNFLATSTPVQTRINVDKNIARNKKLSMELDYSSSPTTRSEDVSVARQICGVLIGSDKETEHKRNVERKIVSFDDSLNEIETRTESRITITRSCSSVDQNSNRTRIGLTSVKESKNYDSCYDFDDSNEHENNSVVFQSPAFPRESQKVSEADQSTQNDDFVTQLATFFEFKIETVHLSALKMIRTKKLENKKRSSLTKIGLDTLDKVSTISKKIFLSKNRSMPDNLAKEHHEEQKTHGEGEPTKTKLDVEYLYILLPYIKKFNGFCGLCVRNCVFNATNISHRQLLRCYLRCVGRPLCPFACSIIVKNDGNGYITVTNSNIRHRTDRKICRPIRAPLRAAIKQQFSHGASVYRLYRESLHKRTEAQKMGRNYDGIGTSRNTLRKIKSEGVTELLLSRETDQGLFKLFERFQAEVNPTGRVKGAIQSISKYPCQVIVFSESSIRLFDDLMKHKSAVLSWDATGSIVKESSVHHLLYYELSITLPGIAKEDSIIPITFMISDAHTLLNVVHWIEIFKHNYAQVFPGKPFARPQTVLSDRALVFLMASLKIWNNETMIDFLNRSYRIVIGTATKADLEKTNIHACLAHVMLDTRKTVNKYLPEPYRDLAMWSIALLIDTSNWNDFKHNWRLICDVFLSLHHGKDERHNSSYDALLTRIRKIRDSRKNFRAISANSSTNEINTKPNSAYDYDSDVDIDDYRSRCMSDKITRKKKIVFDEEEELISTESPFKTEIIEIFDAAFRISDIPKKDFETSTRGILKWFKYLTTSFMPTLAIWSNLLLGDLSRHRRQMVHYFENRILDIEEQRTTAMSERRMGIVKRVQLGGEIHMRLDVLLTILIPDMLSMIEEYQNVLLNYRLNQSDNSRSDNNILFDEQRLKPVQERWREKVSRRNQGHYTRGPDNAVVTDLLSSLLASQVSVNENLKIPTIGPQWLNVGVGMLLSIRKSSRLTLKDTEHFSEEKSWLVCIIEFIEDYSSSPTATFSAHINIGIRNDVPNKIKDLPLYVLEKILIPLTLNQLIVDQSYICTNCQSKTVMRVAVTSIPIYVKRTGLHLENDLYDYFSPRASDLACPKCQNTTIRYIEIIQWPQVIIVKIEDSKAATKQRKPPEPFSLSLFSGRRCVGCPSTTIYELISFNSVIQFGSNEAFIRVTKVKKGWRTCTNSRVIGNGEQLRRYYGNSRILLFERIQHSFKPNIISAIKKCVMDTVLTIVNDRYQVKTLHEACSIIQSNSEFNDLYSYLRSDIITYFYCHACSKIPDSFRTESSEIFLFEISSQKTFFAEPIVAKLGNEQNQKKQCNFCRSLLKNIRLQISNQVFRQCPPCLMSLANLKSDPKDLFQAKFELTDERHIIHHYRASSLVLFSRFSDNIVIIQRDKDKFIQLFDEKFSTRDVLSLSKAADLFDTCSYILIFHHRVHIDATRSSLRIGNR